tara:strand:+ start:1207 stop:2442 length:1236 start_codon:yes stop_codon:yes gene_type:complete
MKKLLAIAMMAMSFCSLSQPDLVVSDLYTDSLCVSGIAYYSVHFVVTNQGDEASEYFCYELEGNEACPDTSGGSYPLNPGSNRSFSVGWLNFNNFGEPLTVELVNDEDEVNTLNNSSTITIPDQHECPPLEFDLSVDTVLYEFGCDVLGPYLEPQIFMSNHGTEDITEFCVKFQILGQTNDTVCFTGQSYLPLASGSMAIQQWPRIYVDGVLSLHLLDVNGEGGFWWMDFGLDENSYNNTYVEVLPNISTSWCTSGCTDELACNYIGDVFIDDGSCEYGEDGYDCDGNCLVDTDQDGICDQFEIPGCTDLEADNYNPDATDDDGTCEYTINLAREVDYVEDLNVYPNPFDDVIYVSTLPGSLCRVRDMNGRIVIERTMSAVISMNLLEGGIYFVDWILDGEVALTKKIVKR